MKTEIAVLIAGIGGATIGILGQIISNYFQHKQQIIRINHERKIELFLNLAYDLENETKEYCKIIRDIHKKKKINSLHTNKFNKIHNKYEMKEHSSKISFFRNKKINRLAQKYYGEIIEIKKMLEKKEINGLIEKGNELMKKQIYFMEEIRKELQI